MHAEATHCIIGNSTHGRQQIHKAKHDNGYVTKKIENFELPWFIPCYYMHLTVSVGETVGEGPKS